MIQLLYGAPGSGKSFYAVNYLLKFCDYDELYDEYILKRDLLVITNIEGLKIKHWLFPDCMGDKSLTEFFTIANFEAIQKKTGKTHIILMLDESHDFFPSGMVNKDLYSFFAYHRHIGLDVILLTQGLTSIARFFNPLFEFVIEAQPRSKKIAKVFKYKFKTLKGETLYIKPLPIKSLVFNAYKSQRVDEFNKPFNPLKVWVCLILLVFAGAFGLFQYGMSNIKERGKLPDDLAEVETKNAGIAPTIETLSIPDSLTAQIKHREKMKQEAEEKKRLEDEKYILLSVEGHIKNSTREAVMINGNIAYIDGVNLRNFDPVLMTIEYKPASGKAQALRAEAKPDMTAGGVLAKWQASDKR